MADWPIDTSMESFRKAWQLEGDLFWATVFEMHKDKMQVKSKKIAIVNLEKIFTATFELSYEKGFQGMSLRDLSRQTGISMGGLYAYIGSKDDLASVIAGVLGNTVDQIIGGLGSTNLPAVGRLRAIIYGEIYSMEILSPWYHFCYMEVKGLPKEQQQQATDLELRFESLVMDAFEQGVESGEFICPKPELLASQITAQLQQWHLKKWKFKLRGIGTQEYAAYIFDNLMLGLSCQSRSHILTLKKAESSSVVSKEVGASEITTPEVGQQRA